MKNRSRHYAHAPITEAVIAFHCEESNESTLGDILQVAAQLKDDYPKRSDVAQVQFRLDTAVPQSSNAGRETIGYKIASGDEKSIAALTPSTFTFSRLAPYDRWETFRDEARRVWSAYASFCHPRTVTRVGVRYINRVDIPDPHGAGVDLDVYFRTAPRIASELPQAMKAYFFRVELPIQRPNGIVIITETGVPPAAPNVVSAILDIDAVVQNVQLGVEDAWGAVEQLRNEKNAVFEACITDATRELIE